jgi:putative transposase
MNKTYQFRLYPTKKQQSALGKWLALCCEVYNAALQERRDAYRMAGVSIGFAHQCAELLSCKQVRPELAEINSQVLQDVVKRVDLAFAAFFRRCQAGEHPGYPRFRSRFRYDSLTFKQYQNSFDVRCGKKQKGTLILSKIGHIKDRSYQDGHASAAQRPPQDGHGETDSDGQMVCEHRRGNRAGSWLLSPIR